MKKTIILLVALSAILPTFGQGTFKFGISGGLNVADISSDKTASLIGFHGGILTEVKFPVELGVEGGLLYSMKGAKVEGNNNNPFNLQVEEVDYRLSYLDVPMVVKLYLLKVLSIQGGPQFSYLLSADYDGNDVKDNLNSADVSAIVGLGVDVSKFRASVRYNFGLTEIADGVGKNNVIQATVGFWIK